MEILHTCHVETRSAWKPDNMLYVDVFAVNRRLIMMAVYQ